MFGIRKKQNAGISYDPAEKKPVIRSSICTGEMVGCLKDLRTGEMEEIMLIRDGQDLARFQEAVGRTDIPKEY